MQSERKPHTESPLPRLVRPVGRSDKSERGIINVRLRIRKVRVVRRVERFGPELKLHVLREAERPKDGQVSFEETGTTQRIASHGAKTRAGFRRPRTIRRAVYSKHRVVKPHSRTRTTLGRGAHSFQNSNRRVELIRHLTAAAREQIRRIALNNVNRQSTHDARHAADLETTKHRARPTFTSEALTFAERQIVHAVDL